MNIFPRINFTFKSLSALLLALALLLSGMPSDKLIDYVQQTIRDRNIVDTTYLSQKYTHLGKVLKPSVKKAHAANFSMQTGYYMGTGASKSISGVGFKPDFLLIKSNTTAGQAAFKTSSMSASSMSFIGATADNTATQLSLDNDGFSLGNNASVNSTNVRYVWTAFSGSDCTSSGTFCVGQYTGNATSPRKITTGFQPSFVIVKRTTAIGGHFHTASQPGNESVYLHNAVRDTSGNFIRDFASDGFNVGHTGTTGDNVSGAVYNFIAFKTTSGVFAEGTYAGDATDNRSISSLGFQPDLVLVKNATNATANNTNSVMNLQESYGDSGSVLTATANTVNTIQALEADGFQIGTHAYVNNTGDTYYWVAFKGVTNYSASGTYEMDVGSYTGTGSSFSVNTLSFKPDLVIIKSNVASQSAFRTSMMHGDITAYLGAATADFAGGITSLNADGFSLGNNPGVNTSGVTYQWQAFGNAYNPYTNSGAADFAVGVYYGNGLDNRNITRLPWQPDFVALKRNNNSAGAWRSSALSGDLTSFFGATAETANYIQALNSNGFQIGTNGVVNTSASLMRWFAFKTGSRFTVGTYTGNATDNRNITGLGFEPDLVWVKRSTAVNGVMKPSSLAGDSTQYFVNTANVADRIQSLISDGFQVGGNQTETNTNTATYRYAAWKIPEAPVISVTLTTDGTVSYGTLNSGETKSTIDLSDTQTAQNDGNLVEDFNIKTSVPAGWTLGAAAGTDTFVHEFSTNSGSNWTRFLLDDTYQSFVSNVAVSGTQNFDLQLTAPNPSSSTSEKTITITIQAVEH